MHYFLLIYLNNKPLHVSSRLAAHHQEDQFCINSKWYRGWITNLPAGSQHKHMIYTNCCTYRFSPPDDEQQACSKHREAYYWNKLTENSAPCWFILYGHITMYGQQNIKFAVHIFVTSAGRLKVASFYVRYFIRSVTHITISLLIFGVICHGLFPLSLILFGWKILKQFSKCVKSRENVNLYRHMHVVFYTSDTLNKS